MDIEQGNRTDPEKLAQLEVGMTRNQVEFLLGKPAIDDPFHADKAYYVYYIHRGDSQQSEQKTMVLTYRQGKLVNIEGGL